MPNRFLSPLFLSSLLACASVGYWTTPHREHESQHASISAKAEALPRRHGLRETIPTALPMLVERLASVDFENYQILERLWSEWGSAFPWGKLVASLPETASEIMVRASWECWLAAEPELASKELAKLAENGHSLAKVVLTDWQKPVGPFASLSLRDPAAAFSLLQAHEGSNEQYQLLFRRWARKDFPAAHAAVKAMSEQASMRHYSVAGMVEYADSLRPAEIRRVLGNLTTEEFVGLRLPKLTHLVQDPEFWLRDPHLALTTNDWVLRDWARAAPARALAFLQTGDFPAAFQVKILDGLVATHAGDPAFLKYFAELPEAEQATVASSGIEAARSRGWDALRESLELVPPAIRGDKWSSTMGELCRLSPAKMEEWVLAEKDPAKQQLLQESFLIGLVGGGFFSPHDHMVNLGQLQDPTQKARALAHHLVLRPEVHQHYATWAASPQLQGIDMLAVLREIHTANFQKLEEKNGQGPSPADLDANRTKATTWLLQNLPRPQTPP